MTRWVALLRGVNVGGGNKVPMADLRRLCEGLGWTGVRSYIASGNLVFEAEGLAEELAADLRLAMVDGMGVDVPVLVLPGEAVRQAAAECPFDPEDGRKVHALFLMGEVTVDRDLFESLKATGDGLELTPGVAWLHTPGGFGTSKLADRLGRILVGADFTARNLNTLARLVEMLDG